jgi:peptidoglycan-associated lipoprotein
MKKILTVLAVLAFTLSLLAGCGGKDQKGPTYPACKTNQNCAEHNQVCMNGTCVDCFKDKHCKGKCMTCRNNNCQKADNCCVSNKDCPDDETCIVKKGGKGTCQKK